MLITILERTKKAVTVTGIQSVCVNDLNPWQQTNIPIKTMWHKKRLRAKLCSHFRDCKFSKSWILTIIFRHITPCSLADTNNGIHVILAVTAVCDTVSTELLSTPTNHAVKWHLITFLLLKSNNHLSIFIFI